MVNSLIERDARSMANIGKLRTCPLTIRGGIGNYLIEEDGRRVLDMSGAAGAASLGYRHPAVVEAAQRGLEEYANAADLFGSSEAAVSLAEHLLSIIPEARDHKVWLGHSGSDANDTAMRTIAAATGRRRFLSFFGAYHGGVAGSMSISSHPSQQHALPSAGLLQLPYPNPYRPLSQNNPGEDVLTYLDFLFSSAVDPSDIGAIFIEPLQSDGGMIVPPDGFLRELARRCRQHGILIVSDEVKVGLGRPGVMHCYLAEGFVPDVVVLGKGLGSGVPVSAVIAPCAVMDFQSAFALITTTGNSVSATVAKAVLETLERENLAVNAQARGRQIVNYLRDQQDRHPLIGDVRGRGLAIGIELVRDRNSRSPATSEAAKVVYRAYELGVFLTYVGLHSNVPELTPPLTLSEDEARTAGEILVQAIDDVEQGRVSDDDVAQFAGW